MLNSAQKLLYAIQGLYAPEDIFAPGLVRSRSVMVPASRRPGTRAKRKWKRARASGRN